MWMSKQFKHENLTYAALWGMLFLAPLMSLYIRTVSDSTLTFDWKEVFLVWRLYAIYFVLFLVHNFLMAPLLVYRQKRAWYCVLVAVMFVSFVLYQCSTKPNGMGKERPHPMAQHDKGPHGMEPRDLAQHDKGPHGEGLHEGPPDADFFDHQPPPKPRHEPRHKGSPPLILGQHDIVAAIILLLMLGMNLGIKLYFKTRDDHKKLTQLEKQNLEQQLEYLKYQINPHFFMNTLNNIHALVDIDPEKAKGTILELSKMMRFILYEGDKDGVPLTREFDFIRNYITLMSLRYTDNVKITLDLPTEVPDRLLPPLMLITFIENSFKHGISYQRESFISIKVDILTPKGETSKEGTRLRFQCSNSKADKPNQEKGGVGLANVKQRLNLLYDNNYTLNIKDETDVYNVELTIPLT